MPRIIKPNGKPVLLPVKYYDNSTPVSMLMFEDAKAERQDVKATVQKASNDLKQKGFKGQISVAIFVPSLGEWRHGSFTDFGDPIYMWDPTEYDGDVAVDNSVTKFAVFIHKGKPTAGGCGNLNNCLWDSIKSFIGEENPWYTPKAMKRYLGLKENDYIDISYMPKIDKKLNQFKCKSKINIMGDHTYTSTANCVREINVKLENAHYTPIHTRQDLHLSTTYDRTPIMFRYNANNPKIMLLHDGYKRWEVDIDQFNLLKKKHIMIAAERKKVDYCECELCRESKPAEAKSLKDQLKSWVKNAMKLQHATYNKINMFKTGADNKTAMT
jgi:hypothetical protein